MFACEGTYPFMRRYGRQLFLRKINGLIQPQTVVLLFSFSVSLFLQPGNQKFNIFMGF